MNGRYQGVGRGEVGRIAWQALPIWTEAKSAQCFKGSKLQLPQRFIDSPDLTHSKDNDAHTLKEAGGIWLIYDLSFILGLHSQHLLFDNVFQAA